MPYLVLPSEMDSLKIVLTIVFFPSHISGVTCEATNLRNLLYVQQGSELTKYPHSSKIREGNQSRMKGFCTNKQSHGL